MSTETCLLLCVCACVGGRVGVLVGGDGYACTRSAGGPACGVRVYASDAPYERVAGSAGGPTGANVGLVRGLVRGHTLCIERILDSHTHTYGYSGG